MNKNTKQRLTNYRKANKGNFGKPAYKKKAKPFPQPNKEGMTISEQREFLNYTK